MEVAQLWEASNGLEPIWVFVAYFFPLLRPERQFPQGGWEWPDRAVATRAAGRQLKSTVPWFEVAP